MLTPLLGSYLEGATDPLWDTGFSPDVMAMSLSAAETAARRAGDALELAGELTSPEDARHGTAAVPDGRPSA